MFSDLNLLTKNMEDEKDTLKTINFECTSKSSCVNFNIITGTWFNQNWPIDLHDLTQFRIADFESFYNITIDYDTNNEEICFKFYYWLAHDSSLTVHFDVTNETIPLTPTYSTRYESPQFNWYKFELCLNHILKLKSNGSLLISLKANYKSDQDVVAISNIADQSVYEIEKKNPADYNVLSYWGKPEAESQWHTYTVSQWQEIDGNRIFKFPPFGSGASFLFSTWFKFSKGLKLNYRFDSNKLPKSINVTLIIRDSKFVAKFSKLVYTMSNFWNVDKKLKTFEIPNTFELGTSLRIEFRIDWSDLNDENVQLALSEVDLSDGCREGNRSCNNNGICIDKWPNVATCVCDPGWAGNKCEYEDWCKRVHDTGVQEETGEEYCKRGGGYCSWDSYLLDHTCSCKGDFYWQHSNKINKSKCVALDLCAPINTLCPTGYLCDPAFLNTKNPCVKCDEKHGYIKIDDECYKHDSCQNACPGGQCALTLTGPQCYCHNGVTYNNKTQCNHKQCTLKDKLENNCQHICIYVNDKPVCECYPGYLFSYATRKCEPNFNLTKQCPRNSIEIRTGPFLNESSCKCLLGFQKSDDSCINICQLSNVQNNSKLIKSICGTEKCTFVNNKINCHCPLPYRVNEKGYCEIDRSCDENEIGYETCKQKRGICVPDLNKSAKQIKTREDTFYCKCPLGKVLKRNRECVDQCDLYFKQCYFHNSQCQRSYDQYNPQPKCVCHPGFKKSSLDQNCYLTDNSTKFEMVIKVDQKKIYHTLKRVRRTPTELNDNLLFEEVCLRVAALDFKGCLSYLRKSQDSVFYLQSEGLREKLIYEQLKLSLGADLKQNFYSKVGVVDIIDYVELNESNMNPNVRDYKVNISVELIDQSSPNITKACKLFGPSLNLSNYCLLPTQTIVKVGSIRELPFRPCFEKHINYCPSSSNCIQNDATSQYACYIKPGYKVNYIFKMSPNSNYRPKEFGEDINECLFNETCKKNEICYNTEGGYNCLCKPGHGRFQNECQGKLRL